MWEQRHIGKIKNSSKHLYGEYKALLFLWKENKVIEYIDEIQKLSDSFYCDYPKSLYPEILQNENRSYDIILIESAIFPDCFIGIPFRTEMRHNNGYHFRFSKWSRHHHSGLDFSKIVIIKNTGYIGDYSVIDKDEYLEFLRMKNKIIKKAEMYIIDYMKMIKIMNHRK